MSAPSIWSFQKNFDFRTDVSPGDPFYEPLESHRGEYNRRRLLSQFELDPEGRLREGCTRKTREALLFGGHIGCGKSTELRKYRELLGRSYTVHLIEVTKLLDINNLQFSDLVIALARALTETRVNDAPLELSEVWVNPVMDWFQTRIIKQERFSDLEAELKAEASLGGGIPGLIKLLATLTSKVKSGASYREELRTEIRNGFSSLLEHFNKLVAHANRQLQSQGQGPLIYILDGTDKLNPADAESFFSAGIHQLRQFDTNLVVCAPVGVLIGLAQVGQVFARIQLPMVKILNDDGTHRPDEEDALIRLVLKRIPLECFDTPDTVRHLVRASGGHVRDLLRLVRDCFDELDAAPITLSHAKTAIKRVATEYQRLVSKEQWADLAAIDRACGQDKDRTESRLRMLHDLVLLEYNSYWWRSHPVLQGLKPYQQAKQALGSAVPDGV